VQRDIIEATSGSVSHCLWVTGDSRPAGVGRSRVGAMSVDCMGMKHCASDCAQIDTQPSGRWSMWQVWSWTGPVVYRVPAPKHPGPHNALHLPVAALRADWLRRGVGCCRRWMLACVSEWPRPRIANISLPAAVWGPCVEIVFGVGDVVAGGRSLLVGC
jgi:hypothetical protein